MKEWEEVEAGETFWGGALGPSWIDIDIDVEERMCKK